MFQALAVFLSTIVHLTAFGPASRLEEVIEHSFQKWDSQDEKFQELDIGWRGPEGWVPALKRFGPKLEFQVLNPAESQTLYTLPKLTATHHISRFVPDNLSAFNQVELMTKADGYRLLFEVDQIWLSTPVVSSPNGNFWLPPSETRYFNADIPKWRTSEFKPGVE